MNWFLSPPARPSARQVRPALEALEDRTVPAALGAKLPAPVHPARPVKMAGIHKVAVIHHAPGAHAHRPQTVGKGRPRPQPPGKDAATLTAARRAALDRATAALRLIDRLTERLKQFDPAEADPSRKANPEPGKLEGEAQKAVRQLRDRLAESGVPKDVLDRLFGRTPEGQLGDFTPAGQGSDITGLSSQPGWTAAPDLLAFRSAADALLGKTSTEQSLPDDKGDVHIKYDNHDEVTVHKDGSVDFFFSHDGSTASVTGHTHDHPEGTVTMSTTQTNSDGTTTATNTTVTQGKSGEVKTYQQTKRQYDKDGHLVFQSNFRDDDVAGTYISRIYPQAGITSWEIIEREGKSFGIDVYGQTVFKHSSEGGSPHGISWCPLPDGPIWQGGGSDGGLASQGLADPADEYGGVAFDLDRFARSLAAYLNSKVNPSQDAPKTDETSGPAIPPGGQLPDPPEEQPGAPAPRPTTGPHPAPPPAPGLSELQEGSELGRTGAELEPPSKASPTP